MNIAEKNRPLISIVVPLYNEEKSVQEFAERVEPVFRKLGYQWELIFALDPCTDRTREKIVELMERGFPVRLLTFTRRIGKPLSVLAGLDHAMGEACIVMDVDLQDPPELIKDMVEKWKEGFKVVIAQRISRKGEKFLYLRAAEIFYWLLEKISEVRIPRNTGDFRLLDARVVREICRFRERHAFLRGLTAAVGFQTAIVAFDRDARFEGRARISLLGAVNIALDGLVPFSRTPVRVIFCLGMAMLGMGLVGFPVWAISSVVSGVAQYWQLIVICLTQLTLVGLVLIALGILGEYLVRSYEETRRRPLYIVDEIRESASLPRKLADKSIVTKQAGQETPLMQVHERTRGLEG